MDYGRTKPMEVLALGMPRTGTMSIQHALIRLGYTDVWHCDPHTLFSKPQLSHAWNRLAHKKWHLNQHITSADLEEVLCDFDACTDIPPSYFWREMLDTYPGAKVILCERDVQTWYQSFVVNLMQSMEGNRAAWWHMHFAEPVLGHCEARMIRNVNLGYFHARTTAGLSLNAREVYKRHYADIRAECKVQGREMLEYRLGSGWEPLCEFLGKEVPKDMEYPRVNDQMALQKEVGEAQWMMVRMAVWRLMSWCVPVVVAGAGGYFYYLGPVRR